jgi:hypothetical protein
MEASELGQALGRIEATLVAVKEKMSQQDGVDQGLNEHIRQLDERVAKLEDTNLRVGTIVGTVLFLMGLLGGATLSGIGQLGQLFK